MKTRSPGALALMIAATVLSLSGVWAANAEEPEHDQTMKVDCSDKIDDLKTQVKACLDEASDLEDARECWAADH